MSWKNVIKSCIPIFPLPFFKRHKAQILEYSRSDYFPERLWISDENLPYYFRPGCYEKDYQDILEAYPDELDLVEPLERARTIRERFEKNHPCFIVREKGSEHLLGVLWAVPGGFPFLTSNRKKYDGKTIFTQVNNFVIHEMRSRGIGKFLSFRTIHYLFSELSCDYIHSLIQDYRLPSLISNLKAGSVILGTLYDQNIFGTTIEHFYRVNSNPFFNSFPRVPVIVISRDGSNPLGIARSLGRKKIPVYVLSLDSALALKRSRYVKKIVYIDSLDDCDILKEKLEEILRYISSDMSSSKNGTEANLCLKPILVPTNELHYRKLFPIEEFISERFEMMTPLKKVDSLLEKQQQFPHAEKAGFRVLDTIILEKVSDIDDLEKKTSFPVIVRPGLDCSRKSYPKKTELFHSYDELKEQLTPILEKGDVELIVQEYIPGNDENVVFFMASCTAEGTPRAWFHGKKIRQFEPGHGLMASGIIDPDPDTEFVQKCKNLCRSFALGGFIGIECKKHSETGEYYYIESSLRPEGNNSIGIAAGVDLVLDSYLSVLNFPCGIVRKDKLKGSWSCFELEYASAMSMKKSGDKNWRKVFLPLPRPISFAYFSWDDPFPFCFSFARDMLNLLKKFFRRGKNKTEEEAEMNDSN